MKLHIIKALKAPYTRFYSVQLHIKLVLDAFALVGDIAVAKAVRTGQL
jgi:hypothetical protein